MATTLDVNKHLDIVGRMGCRQWLIFILLGLIIAQFGWDSLMVVFTHQQPQFRCADDITDLELFTTSNLTYDNKCELTTVIGNVTVTKKCQQFVYNNAEHGETVIERFDLVCERTHISTIIEMASIASTAVGMVFGSYFSDRFGRKPLCILPCLFTSIFGIVQAFSVNVTMYAVSKVLCGVASSVIFSPVFMLMMESVSTGNRPHVLNGLELWWIAGTSSLSLIAYLFKSWWKTQLFCSVPGIAIGIAFIWCLDESPHWLTSKNRTKEALTVLHKMAKWNRVATDGLSFDHNSYVDKEEDAETVDKRESFLRIWTHKRIVIRFFVFSYAWVTCGLCYYALSYGVRRLPGSIYINNTISSFAEGLAYLACFCIAWWGRKWPTIASFLGGGIALLVLTLITEFAPESGWPITAMSMIGKMFVSASWQIIIVWGAELYPTNHRCILVALNTLIGRLGATVGPLLLDLERFIDLPKENLIMPIIFVILMVIGGFLHLIPPETNNRLLPEYIKDANRVEFPMDTQLKNNGSENDEESANETRKDLLEPVHTEEKV